MNLLFSHFYVKSTQEALQDHTVVTVTIFLKVDFLNLKLILGDLAGTGRKGSKETV